MNVSTPITENTAAEPPFSAEILTFSGHINISYKCIVISFR